MRTAEVLFKDEAAGTLNQHDDGSFSFAYDPSWGDDPGRTASVFITPGIPPIIV